ncbi:COP9 signalosome (CSN) subunit [Thecaphora frezii]
MRPAHFADQVIRAEKANDGHQLAQLFAIGGPISQAVLLELGDPRPNKVLISLRKCSGYLVSPWEEICQSHLLSLYYLSLSNTFLDSYSSDATDPEGKTRAERLHDSFDAMNTTVTAFLRHFSSLQAGRWALPLLRILLLNLRWLAIQADSAANPPPAPAVRDAGASSSSSSAAAAAAKAQDTRTSSKANKRLEECARQLNKAFTACIADRNPDMDESRKWGTYEVVGMVFKTYFKLKSISLCKNILRAISAAALPPLDQFPRAHQVTFRYYVGVLAFLGEEYAKAETDLLFAFTNCHPRAVRNQEMILTYLLPTRLLLGHLPSPALLNQFPRLSALYSRFIASFAHGDVRTFDQHLSTPVVEKTLVARGVYLALERAREGCLRSLFRRVWIARDRQTRMALDDFWKALRFVKIEVERSEAEWVVAGLIYKGYIKGYIAHERGIVVLSAKDAFPKLGSFTVVS